MFNNKVIDFLSTITSMTDTVILKHPNTVALSEGQDVVMLFDVSELDSETFPDIGLKNSLGNFLDLVKLFGDDRDISIEGNTISIGSGKKSASFITDNIALMEAYDRDAAQFTKTEEAPSVATFDIDVEDIKDIKSATGVFKDLSEVLFTSQDGDMLISLAETGKFNSNSNTYSTTKTANTSKEFSIKIPVENFKMIPSSEYQIDVKYNSNMDSYRILMTSKTFSGFKLLLSVKA